MQLRTSVWCVLVTALVLAVATTAAAHTEIRATSPRDGASLSERPRVVTVSYTNPLARSVSAVVESAGRSDLAGPPRLSPRDASTLVIPLRPGGSGRFDVRWTVLGADGHELAGQMSFSVRTPALATDLARLGTLITEAARRIENALELAKPPEG